MGKLINDTQSTSHEGKKVDKLDYTVALKLRYEETIAKLKDEQYYGHCKCLMSSLRYT